MKLIAQDKFVEQSDHLTFYVVDFYVITDGWSYLPPNGRYPIISYPSRSTLPSLGKVIRENMNTRLGQ